MRPTDAWVNQYIAPRLTARDKEILQFVHDYRIVTSDQLARLFWTGRSNAQRLCNRRLQSLIELRCLARYYPLAQSGKAYQHLTLDIAGAKVLGSDKWRKVSQLPLTFRHQVLVAEFAIRAKDYNLRGGIPEYALGPVRVDLYYPAMGLAVEADTGTASHKQLVAKAKRYRRVQVSQVVMVTEGSKDRLQVFLGELGCGVGAHFEQLDKLLQSITR